MLTCFVCKQVINNPETLFRHIKEEHKICGNNCKVQCTLCWKMLSNFSTFKKHVSKCFDDAETAENVEEASEAEDVDHAYMYAVDAEICNFESELRKCALRLACALSAKMNWPRKDVFTTISEFNKTFMSKVISGIEEIIMRCVRTGEEENVDNFINAIKSSIQEVETEKKFESALAEMDLICTLLPCEIVGVKKPKKKRRRRKQRKVIEGTEETFSVDGRKHKRKRNNESSDGESEASDSESEASDGTDEEAVTEKGVGAIESSGRTDETEEEEIEFEKEVIVIMPIQFQIKKFFELPNVFEKVKLNTEKIQEGTQIDHFVKGRLWKKILENYNPDQLVIPFYFYGDGAQINNPLGPHTKPGELQFNYFAFPTIPTEYASRLENIFVAQIYPAKYHEQFDNEQIYNNIIDIFITLANDGIILNINGENVHVFFVCALFIGDHKELNARLGFVANFSRARHCCRYCKMNIDDMKTKASSQQAIRRNRENYDVDVAMGNPTTTGIKEYSIFNRIPFFHVTVSSGVDLAHDLTEGVLHTVFTKSISYFTTEKQYFDIDVLNKRMQSMDFGAMEKGNLPTDITVEKLNSDKLKMISSEMFFFAHHFTLMIGDLIPDEDPVYKLVLTTIKFFDLCYLPSFDQHDIEELRDESEKLNASIMELFEVDLKFKSHIITHYHELVEDIGPLRYVQTIRFEGKHKPMKSYGKNTNNRINLPYSIAKKVQFNFAFRLLQNEGLNDRIHAPSCAVDFIRKRVYYQRLPPSPDLIDLSSKECFFLQSVTVNGIIFSKELWLPKMMEDKQRICEVIDIFSTDLEDVAKIWVVCKVYADVTFEPHYNCHMVHIASLQEELEIINMKEYLLEHEYPVKIHIIEKKRLFRCKRF